MTGCVVCLDQGFGPPPDAGVLPRGTPVNPAAPKVVVRVALATGTACCTNTGGTVRPMARADCGAAGSSTAGAGPGQYGRALEQAKTAATSRQATTRPVYVAAGSRGFWVWRIKGLRIVQTRGRSVGEGFCEGRVEAA